jgi:integrase/recombinase XerD
MANRKASIWLYRKVDGKWRYARPSYGRNGKIRPEAGTYYVRWYEGKKAVWRKCSSAADATVACERQEAYLTAFAHGLSPSQTFVNAPLPVLFSNTLGAWLAEYALSHKPESASLMAQTLNEFVGWARKDYVAKVTRVDLLRYRQWLIGRKRSARTAANKMLRVNQFIRSVLGLAEGKGPVTVKDAKFTETEPTVYSPEGLKVFFAGCNQFLTAVFKTYLMSGLRKAELENLEWADVDLVAGTVRVTAKDGWQPKDWEERTIEVPDELLGILKELPHRGKLVFANSEGHHYTHSWDDCKKVAEKAELSGFHPHKFRATFATTLLQSGVDLKTVQKLLGHKDLESTMRYLSRAESKKTRAAVNAAWA